MRSRDPVGLAVEVATVAAAVIFVALLAALSACSAAPEPADVAPICRAPATCETYGSPDTCGRWHDISRGSESWR